MRRGNWVITHVFIKNKVADSALSFYAHEEIFRAK